jgi:hypothetical protein
MPLISITKTRDMIVITIGEESFYFLKEKITKIPYVLIPTKASGLFLFQASSPEFRIFKLEPVTFKFSALEVQ